MGPWFDYVRYGWPVATGVFSICLVMLSLWLNSRFVTKADAAAAAGKVRAELDRVASDHACHDKRLTLVEQQTHEPPSRHDLDEKIGHVLQRVAHLESGMDGIRRQLGTANEYLHTLVERGLGR